VTVVSSVVLHYLYKVAAPAAAVEASKQATMEALGANKFGSYEDKVLDWVSIPNFPSLNPKDVLIKVSYSDLNPVDLQKLKGGAKYGHPVPKPPFIPGYGGSGTVQEVGSNGPQHLLGKAVCFLGIESRSGSYASHIVVDSRCVAETPPNVDPREAATIPVAGLTAYECLVKLGLARDVAIVQEGKLHTVGLEGTDKKETRTEDATASLLIVGGSGGVGSWLITLVRAWHPHIKIIATASPGDSQEWCTTMGASHVMGHNEIEKNLQGGKQGSVDHIICLTEPTQSLFATLSEVIKPYGQICLVVAGKSIESLNLGFCFFKCVNILTQTVFSSQRNNYQNIVPSQELAVLLALLSNQTIVAPLSPDLEHVSEKFKDALKDDKSVLKLLAGPHRRGKLVMRINAGDELIFMDLKTGSLIQIPRKDCIEQKMMQMIQRQDKDVWQEEAHSQSERDELIKKITLHKTLGIVKVTEKQCDDYEDGIVMQEAEGVLNLWGVQLKKRDKNAKGEEFIFLDPRSGAIGELSRMDCIEKGFICIEKVGDETELVLEAVTDFEERDKVAQTVRESLKLNFEGIISNRL
jgi:NADPH2:quinone reductase